MTSILRCIAACALTLAATFLALAGPVSESLQVSGTLKTSLMLKADDLKAFPAEQISSMTLTRKIDDEEQSSTVRGVRLSAILERAGVVSTDRNDWKHMVVLASATDGYRVTFSWPELINTEVGAGVLVIFERDGQALNEGEGRIALISSKDLRAGPRQVKWLNKIELRLL